MAALDNLRGHRGVLVWHNHGGSCLPRQYVLQPDRRGYIWKEGDVEEIFVEHSPMGNVMTAELRFCCLTLKLGDEAFPLCPMSFRVNLQGIFVAWKKSWMTLFYPRVNGYEDFVRLASGDDHTQADQQRASDIDAIGGLRAYVLHLDSYRMSLLDLCLLGGHRGCCVCCELWGCRATSPSRRRTSNAATGLSWATPRRAGFSRRRRATGQLTTETRASGGCWSARLRAPTRPL